MFILDARHNADCEPELEKFDTYDDAVDKAHKHFSWYEFEVRGGRPYDSGNATSDGASDGFEVFEDVEMHNGKVAAFTHCGGEGPTCKIYEV
jgi:hypothetical protein